eukprot:909526-Rhodomonas_salina.2
MVSAFMCMLSVYTLGRGMVVGLHVVLRHVARMHVHAVGLHVVHHDTVPLHVVRLHASPSACCP